jgi:hypothetical protein
MLSEGVKDRVVDDTMLCRPDAGTIVVWLGYVTVGTTPITPSAYVPWMRNLRITGIFKPCWSACVTYSGFMPSMEITMSGGAVWARTVLLREAVETAKVRNTTRRIII